jgi:membrane protein DedA with SNARE-associated domain
MPLRWYLPAAVVGSVIWAVLYATIGLAVVQAWLAAEAGSWWGVLVVVVVIVAVVAWLVARRRRARTPSSERFVPVD